MRTLGRPGAAVAAVVAACAVASAAPVAADEATPSPTAETPVSVSFSVATPDGGRLVETAVAPTTDAARQMVRSLRATPGVRAANLTVPMRRFGAAASQVAPAATDPRLAAQWGLATLGFAGTRRWSTGQGVVVAVVDDGVDRSHPDLAGALLAGRNVVSPGRAVDPGSHGTHVSGIIAARFANGVGGAGLAPRARILPVDVFGDGEFTTDSLVARGVIWAAQQPGVRVINMSLGGAPPSDILRDAVTYARSRNIVVVAAAGNDGDYQVNYPAGFTGVIGVGAVDAGLDLTAFSSRGPHVDLVAPGQDILSTSCRLDFSAMTNDVCPRSPATGQVTHIYERMAGTSMATPFVSAAAALLAARFPGWTNKRIATELMGTARDLGPAGRDDSFGHGLVQPLVLLRGAPGKPAGSSVVSDTSAPAVTIRWSAAPPGPYGIASWQVRYRLDGGAWKPAVTVPYAGNTCTPTPCSLRIEGVPLGRLVQSRVVAVARVTGVVSAATTASRWHGVDAGQTVADATPLAQPGQARGVIATDADQDWFVVQPAGTTLQVTLSGRTGVIATVYAAADTSTPLASGAATAPGGLSVTGLTPGGQYVVVVSGTAAALSPFLLAVS